jgi:hypothetical protein
MSGEQVRSRNAAKTSDEEGATPAFDARCVTALHGVAPASLTVKIESLDGEEFVRTGSRDGFPVKKVRFSFCISEIATSSLCRKRISRESKNLGKNAGRERPHFFGFQPPKKFLGSPPPIVLLTRPFVDGSVTLDRSYWA